ncbi:MAG: chemotaxis protein CheX [Agarilytica sp.]
MQPNKNENTANLDTRFIRPFLHGAKKVCRDMAGIEPLAQTPKPILTCFPVGDVASVMPMKSPQLIGQLCISFTKLGISSLAKSLVGETVEDINELALDLAGEVTNMVTGVAKAKLEADGFDFDMARPVSYSTEEMTRLNLKGTPRIVVPYEIATGHMFIDLGFISR